MKLFTLLITICLIGSANAFGGGCGRDTSEIPAGSSENVQIDGGNLRSIKASVLYPNGDHAELVIAEVYKNHLKAPVDEIDYRDVEQILKVGRLLARETDQKGRFCFDSLPPGNYMLRVNTSGKLSQFATMLIFVTIVGRKEQSTQDRLEIKFDLAI